MPELLKEGLPPRSRRSKFDFSEWTDGQAWKFVRGTDYDSSTETFRMNVRKWGKENGFKVEVRPYAALDTNGEEIPLSKSDAVALGVRFIPASSNGGVQRVER